VALARKSHVTDPQRSLQAFTPPDKVPPGCQSAVATSLQRVDALEVNLQALQTL
jgi:hypothetical protein